MFLAPLLGRMMFALLVIAAMLIAARAAALSAIGANNPEAALWLDQTDPLALSRVNDLALERSGGKVDPDALTAAARRALLAEPLNPIALRQIGLGHDALSNRKRARRLFELGNRVSRRDLLTQLWTIEDRAASNDIRGALVAYDTALSSSRTAPMLLYPVLSNALSDRQISSAFAPYLDKGRAWMPGFLNYVVTMSEEPQALAALVLARGGMPPDPGFSLETKLLGRLVGKAQFDWARRYALSIGGARAMTNLNFTDATTDPRYAPLSWELMTTDDVEGRREGSDEAAFIAQPNSRDVAAVRILLHKAGRYRFAYRVKPLANHEEASLEWNLQCLSPTSGPTGDVLREPATPGVDAIVVLVIPASCTAQRLAITIAGRDAQSASGLRVGRLSFQPFAASPRIPSS